MAVELPASEEVNPARALLAAAGAALKQRRPVVPPTFVAQLYGRAVPEDVEHYSAAELTQLAERAWDFLRVRAPGTPKIRCETVDLPGTGEPRRISVVEIVNDDMPFLVNSVMGELADRKLPVRLVAHPVFGVERDGEKLVALGTRDAHPARESFIHIHLDPLEKETCVEVVRALDKVLAEVQLAVQDWRPMLERVNAIVAELKTNPPPLPVDEIAEAIQFLQWLLADNFTFLGLRDYTFDGHALEPDHEGALGIMRSRDLRVLKRGEEHLEITPEIMAFLKEPRPLIIAKANIHARVHRRAYLDYVGVKRFDAAGNLVGEFRIVGLFTSTAYTRSAHGIPYLRRKLAAIERRAGFEASGHSGKALANVLEHYPRDELFQVDEDTLYRFVTTILQLDERPRVRVLARLDRFDRFVSAMVYVPRERYDSGVRARIGDYLAQAFDGRVSAFYPFFPESPMVRVHFIIGRSGAATPPVDQAKLEHDVAAIVRTWNDELAEVLAQTSHAARGARIVRALPRRVLRRLPRHLFAADGRRRHPSHRAAQRAALAGGRFPPPGGPRRPFGRSQSVELRAAAAAVGTRAGAGKHGLPGGERAHLPDRAGRLAAHALAARYAARARGRRRDRSRRRQGAAGSRLPDGDARGSRERRL